MNPNQTRAARFSFFSVALCVIAAATVTGRQQGRKTTDPPVQPTGKLGQDLFLAIDHRDIGSVKALIAKGADPNSRNGLEFTPLFIAAASFQPDVMGALLEAGAKVDADSAYGTALTFAAMSGDYPGAQILIDRGADVDTTRSDGTSVLMMAANAGSAEIVSALIKKKADVGVSDRHGATALALAARGGHAAVVKLLLDAGAAVDEMDRERATPLMHAAMNGRADVVTALLKRGANANAKNAEGRTALILAAAYADSPKTVGALLKGGADAKLIDRFNRNAAAYAAARGYRSSVALLGKPNRQIAFRSVKVAVPASLNALQTSMSQFTKMTQCISCHQEGLGRITTGEAADRGLRVDVAVDRDQRARILGALNAMKPLHEGALHDPEVMKQVPLIEINEVSTIDGWLLAGLSAHHEPTSPATAATAQVLARQQSPDGFWSFSVPRVPMQSSFFTFTALAVKALKAYMPKEASAETTSRLARARAWLLAAQPKTSEDRAGQLLGLNWAGASPAQLNRVSASIQKDQRADGGWSQIPGGRSDAYATGQALYALHVGGGMPVTNAVYKQGIAYLLRTQDDDGSWFVAKRAIPANNYFDAKFSHGESQYASFNGTCWATLALMQTLPSK